MTITKTDMLNLGRQQAQLFLADNFTYAEFLVTCDCPRSILVMCYQGLVWRGKITALEDMLTEEQQKAGELAKTFVKDRLPRKGLIEVVKSLIAIEYFLTLN